MYLLNAYRLTAQSGKDFTFCTKTMMDALLAYNNQEKDPIRSVLLISSSVLSEFNAEDVSGDIPSGSSQCLYAIASDDTTECMMATTVAEALGYYLEYRQKEPYHIYQRESGVVFPQEPIQ